MDLWARRPGGNGNSGKLGQVTALVNTGVSARRRLLQLAGYSSGRSDYEMAREQGWSERHLDGMILEDFGILHTNPLYR